MKYAVRINKRIRYLRTFTIIKRFGEPSNLLTKVFIRIFSRKKRGEAAPV
jgi:hypothetical protein